MKKLFPILVLSLATVVVGSIASSNILKAEALEELSISNSGDAFVLSDVSYEANESFVYTADLHFKSGQAGGIAFGSKENEYYYVLNMDRYENKVKLLYFASNGAGGYNPTELKNEYFIGNDKITENELAMVNPRVRDIENVNLKVILTVEDEHAYAEFYVEGIKRFGIDSTIDLNTFGSEFTYKGGYLGMNCFNSDVYLNNIEYGKSDYSYFSEPYRNQYHLQPFAKWTNDPNALCYYEGYYHVYYQCNPFGNLWGDMYWGHARSRDLIHFEFLPICLFPETEGMGFGPGNAYMWSGCAITYKQGMSIDVDYLNWFPNGGGSGMMAVYTRDGARQDQVIITSDDGGLTWSKRYRIPQAITGIDDVKIDLRDPKIFPLQKDEVGNVRMWGMTLSSYGLNKGWFFKSNNLLDWSQAGTFALPTPECIGVGFLEDENGDEHAYLTNKSRTYILGTLNYNESTQQVDFIDEDGNNISNYSLAEMNERLKPLDFGPDTYASQSFYISDPTSEFYGKDVVLNWFSGDLNASFCTGPGEYAGLRGRWNGGFTIPVKYGVRHTSEGLRITQKPITVNNSNLEKEEVVNLTDVTLTSDSDNPLNDVHTHVFEMDASITTSDEGTIAFKVDVGENEYMAFGWNKVDGYYVDRTYLDDKGINTNIDWHVKYASHILGDSDTKTFYILSDNGGLEVFCEDFSIPFYFVTTASIYSRNASLKADSAVINSLKLNEVKSIWRKDISSEEGILYVSSDEATLDTEFANSKYITAWFSGNKDLTWELLSGEDVIDYQASNQGVNIIAKASGTASLKVSVDNQEKVINVTVYESNFESEFTFKKDNIISGQWIMSDSSIIGEKASGNAFLLADQSGSDFIYTGQFDILSGTAASLVFRASSDMSSYLVANYDSNEKVVKLWSTHGELARSAYIDVELSNINLTVKANAKDVQISINGNSVINYTLGDNEPLSGRFGLNVFSAKVAFKSLTLSVIKENYEYNSGTLEIDLEIEQFITAVYNITLGNVKLEPGFYYQNGNKLYIRESYFELLPEDGRYQFKIVGSAYSFTINVDVILGQESYVIDDITTEVGLDVTVYIGKLNVNSIKVNGEVIDNSKYHISDYTLHISKDCFIVGTNEVTINDSINFNVNVIDLDDTIVDKETHTDYAPIIIGVSVGGGALVLGAAILVTVLVLRKRKK